MEQKGTDLFDRRYRKGVLKAVIYYRCLMLADTYYLMHSSRRKSEAD
jgi:hypothetical protein